MTELPLNSMTPRKAERPIWRWVGLSALIAVLVVLFLYGTMRQAMKVNNHHDDQDAFMAFTLALVDDPTYIDGNRMPLFPMLVRVFYHDGMSMDALFWQGVAVGIGVSLICITALGLYFFRVFPPSLAIPLTLIVAFLIYVITAPYYKPETLYYTLSFFAFVLMCGAFQRLTPRLAVGIGVLIGLAMLAKASAPPLIAAFVAFKMLQIVYDAWHSRHDGGLRRALASLGSLALVVVVFLVVISGYLSSSRRLFGTYFYNVNTTFYMWYDNYDQVRTGTRSHNDRTGWPDLPPEQIPSLGAYLATHSPQQIVARLADGLPATFSDHCGPDYDTLTAHCKYIGTLSVIALALIVTNLPLIGPLLRRHGFLIGFCLVFIVVSLLTASWYRPISKGQRFSMPVVLPILFLLASFINLPQLRRLRFSLRDRQIDLVTVALALMTVAIVLDSLTTLTWRVFRVRGAN